MPGSYNDSRENRYNGRSSNSGSANRPAPLPEGFALYYVAALCPDAVNEQVSGYKQYMQDKYGCRAAQKSPAHLTIIPPFKAEEEMEKMLLDFVDAFNFGIVPFDIQLQGFDHFDEKVLFVAVPANESLSSMEQEVNQQFNEAFPAIIFRTRPAFHPHVTIATRDIPGHRFSDIWRYFEEQQMEAQFACKGLTVMKLTRGLWQAL